jgi:PAS domain S-box-containing protein
MFIQEDYFKNIFNTVRESILILDENMSILSANRSFFTTFKVNAANTIGSRLYDLGNGQWNIMELRVLLEDVLPKNDTVDNYEIEHTFESIGRKTMLLNACKIREKKDDLPIILLAIEDITERKEIEAGLENTRKELVIIKKTADEAGEFAESVINTVREPLISLDQDLRVVTVSRSFCEFFKVKSEETVGQLIYDLGNRQWDIPKLRDLLETILPDKATFENYEVEHDFTTIGRRVMLLNARQIRRGQGKERIILLAIEDITERKRLEDLLSESEERYRRLFETASDGIVLLEKSEGHIVHANPAAEKMLGYSKEEYAGKKLQDIGVSLDMSDFAAIMQSLNSSGILNYDDVPIKTRSGQDIYADIYLVDRAKLAQCNIRDVTDRKRAMTALMEASRYSQQIIESAQEGLIVYGTDLTFGVWNPYMEQLTGLPAAEVLGRHPLEVFPFLHEAGVMAGIERALAGEVGRIERFQFHIPKTGRSGWLSEICAPLQNVRGEIIGVIGTVSNVTEHIRIEEALRGSQQVLEGIINAIPVRVFWKDKNLVYLGCNTAFARDAGFADSKDVVGKDDYQMGWRDQAELYSSDDRQVIESGGSKLLIEEPQTTPEGDTITLLTSKMPLLSTTGEIIGVLGVYMDITEFKRAEQALYLSEKKFKDLLETINLIAVMLDRSGNISFCNDYFLHLTGWTRDEVLNRSWFDLFLPADIREATLSMFTSGIAEGTIPAHNEYLIITRDGNKKHIEWNHSLLRDTKGEVIGVASIGNDVTEHRKLEDQLRHAQKMEAVGTLAGGVAHDFNNILNVIMGYGTMVMETLAAGSTSKEQMSEVLIAADRAADLTKRLLVFSRKQMVEVKPVNVNELILGVQKMLVRLIRESIEIKLDLAEKPLIVSADAGQLEQVLINLASNAKDAMQEGGRLTIKTGLEDVDDEYVAAYGYGKPGRYALITVTDTGQGMDAETQRKIFEPFFTTKGIGEGTGLGLSICYGIIKQHSGYIKVYSEPGHGTVFKIYLPLSEEAASVDMKAKAAVPVNGGNETILVAEDDASLEVLTRIILESSGYSVITAKDGDDAITKFMENREHISLVILDMIMPKKNGKEVGEAIRKVSPRMKILFVSGYTMDVIKTADLTEAEFNFMHKPFIPKDLLIKVREVLDR